MNSNKSYFVLAGLILILLASCKKEVVIEDFSCNLQTASKTFTEPELEVTYKLEAFGEFTVISWFYWDETGKVEVLNPVIPSEVTVTLSSQKKLLAGALGKVKEGSIKVSYKGVTATSDYVGLDQCLQELY